MEEHSYMGVRFLMGDWNYNQNPDVVLSSFISAQYGVRSWICCKGTVSLLWDVVGEEQQATEAHIVLAEEGYNDLGLSLAVMEDEETTWLIAGVPLSDESGSDAGSVIGLNLDTSATVVHACGITSRIPRMSDFSRLNPSHELFGRICDPSSTWESAMKSGMREAWKVLQGETESNFGVTVGANSGFQLSELGIGVSVSDDSSYVSYGGAFYLFSLY
jgi:hypothetical protein